MGPLLKSDMGVPPEELSPQRTQGTQRKGGGMPL
jgi:hypothetical protein